MITTEQAVFAFCLTALTCLLIGYIIGKAGDEYAKTVAHDPDKDLLFEPEMEKRLNAAGPADDPPSWQGS